MGYEAILTYSASDRLEKARAKAEELGCVVVLPKANELQVDLDSAEAYDEHLKRRAILAKHCKGFLVECLEAPSKSGFPKLHVTIVLSRDVSALERVALQSLLGSDPVRELLSWVAIEKKTNDFPTLFFEPKVPGLVRF